MTITRGIDHVGLSVKDLEASKRFFKDILEFEIINEKEGEYAFVSDRTTMVTLWQTAKTSANIQTAGLHHIALSVESIEVLRQVETKLRDNNYKIQFDGMGVRGKEGGNIALFFYDPSDIRIELVSPDKDQSGEIPVIGSCGDIE
jgi:lactoylglutathione lyase